MGFELNLSGCIPEQGIPDFCIIKHNLCVVGSIYFRKQLTTIMCKKQLFNQALQSCFKCLNFSCLVPNPFINGARVIESYFKTKGLEAVPCWSGNLALLPAMSWRDRLHLEHKDTTMAPEGTHYPRKAAI